MDLNQPTPTSRKPNGWALMPLAVFLGLYLGTSIAANDFYKMPVTVAFLAASVYAIATTRGLSINERIFQYSAGAANKNIMLMIWIFLLAGAFAQAAESVGAIDATVNLTLQMLPGKLLLAGIFLASCFISLSIGTSVGTIVALAPVAVGIAEKTGIDTAFMTGLVMGGAFFGDNLSFISDTTIAATRTQGCAMKDKFKVNIQIAATAAFPVLVLYLIQGAQIETPVQNLPVEWVKVLPYFLVLGFSILGVNVTIVLLLGLVSTGIITLFYDTPGLSGWMSAMGSGMTGMGELIMVTLMAGGMLELVRFNGGIDYVLHKLTRRIKSKRGAELSIASLVALTNLCTANNTIAILTAGPLASGIARQYKVDPRRSASLLDIFSCVIQGAIPYGAQMLLAAELTGQSPLRIVIYLYYPFALALAALLAILFRFPRKYT